MNATTENIEHSRLGGKIIDTAPPQQKQLSFYWGGQKMPPVFSFYSPTDRTVKLGR